MELKDQIRLSRESAGLTQLELANKLGVSKQSIVWWETGEHRPKPARLKDFAKVLNVRFDLSEIGNATQIDDNKKSIAVDPEFMSIAIAISRLPKKFRESVVNIIRFAEGKMMGEMPFSPHHDDSEKISSDTIVTRKKTRTKEFDFIEKRGSNGAELSKTITGGKGGRASSEPGSESEDSQKPTGTAR